jgi:hypothetical protein
MLFLARTIKHRIMVDVHYLLYFFCPFDSVHRPIIRVGKQYFVREPTSQDSVLKVIDDACQQDVATERVDFLLF